MVSYIVAKTIVAKTNVSTVRTQKNTVYGYLLIGSLE